MKSRVVLNVVLLTGTLVIVAGCSSEETAYREFSETDLQAASENDHHEDAHHHEHHAEKGPHGGDLVEVGGGKYHAELVHEGASVTVYVLDGEAKATVPIAASEVTINLKHGEKPEQFKLAASPIEGDPEGKSSRFVSSDVHLSEDLDHEGIEARLALEIDGQSYTGHIEHSHDHSDKDEHEHAHGDDEKHEHEDGHKHEHGHD